MLVLSRRVGESIVVGDEIVVTVLDVRGDVVRVGIDAPRSLRVHRREVYDAVEKANREAAAAKAPESAVDALRAALRDRAQQD